MGSRRFLPSRALPSFTRTGNRLASSYSIEHSRKMNCDSPNFGNLPNVLQLVAKLGPNQQALRVARLGIPAAHVGLRGGKACIKNTNIAFDDLPCSADGSITYWLSRLGAGGATFSGYAEDAVLLSLGDLTIAIDKPDAAGIAWEIFCGASYEFSMPCEEAIVIDVGMNLGFTSLAFLREPWCKHVYGFEPSEKTFSRAQRNFALNPRFARRCTSMNFGLGADNEKVLLHAADGRSGNATIALADVSSQTFDDTSEEVEIRRADVELEAVYSQIDPDIPVVLKMDCEGAESQIFSVLSDDLISRLKVILLEWHSRKILQEIQDRLSKNGFVSFVDEPAADVGILRAINVTRAS